MPMHAPPAFDADLVRRYDRNGPRYTSYPSALQFGSKFGVADYRRAALLSNAAPAKPLSVYVHVPFCAYPCFYCGCNKVVTHDRRHAQEYLQRLEVEIELQGALFEQRRLVQQIHFGGGTPTFFTIEQLGRVLDQLRRGFRLDPSQLREFSIEIDPRMVTSDTFTGLSMLGFNRASFDIQDFDPAVQQAVNREQSVEQVQQALEQARTAGFRSISFDLIYGLPLQSTATFAGTLDRVVALRPDRIAVYEYAHMPRMFSAQRAIETQQLPGAEERLRLLALTVSHLTEAGYVHIGMDHFALPTDELCRALHCGDLHRNFQGYSTRADCDLIGLGVSAIGSIGNVYAQNCKRLAAYYEALDHGRLAIERGLALNMDDIVRREVIQRILCNGVIVCRDIEEQYALDFTTYFEQELAQLRLLAADGLLSQVGDMIVVSDAGRFLLRTIAMVFDPYARRATPERYSKVRRPPTFQ